MDVPDINYADSDGVGIAWQQYGSGPDVLIIPGLVGNIELMWEHEFYRRGLEYQGRHCRVTVFDKRGLGLSDRFHEPPTLENRVADIVAVMDAAGLDSASLVGVSEGGLMAQVFAATQPDRVERLVCANTAAGLTLNRQLLSDEELAALVARFQRLIETWGRDPKYFVDWFSPSVSDNAAFVRWNGRFQRSAGTQADVAQQFASIATLDQFDLLGDITAPTLIMNSEHELVVDPRSGDLMAERIQGALRKTIDSDDHTFFLNENWLEPVRATLEFITGSLPVESVQRRFSTVLFTDIVGSTAASSAAGDEAWARKLDEHDRLAWATIDGHGGVIVKSTGDGLLARFDMPSQAIDFAREFRRLVGDAGLSIRAGLHAGEIEVRENDDITGIGVNLAARVEQAARDGSIYVSSTIKDMMLGSSVGFESCGAHSLKGIGGEWQLFEVV